MPAIRSYTYPIRSYHTNAHGRLFIHQLLNFFQDAAHNHADGQGFGQKQLVPQNLFWVLSRLSIEIIELPQLGDKLVLSTWVKSIRGSVSEREFSISVNNGIIINASSLWFCLSGETHRPIKLPEAYSGLMSAHNEYATTAGTKKVKVQETDLPGSAGAITRAVNSDIDMANHVNNATYVRWLMDELTPEIQHAGKLEKLDINYLGECFLGEEVFSQHYGDEKEIIHESQNKQTGKVLLRAFSRWQ